MWIRASYTVENAVIVPVFSMIIILIISFTCNIHDEIIKENVMSQIGIENELSEMNSDRRNDFEKIAEEYLKERCIFCVRKLTKKIKYDMINRKIYAR